MMLPQRCTHEICFGEISSLIVFIIMSKSVITKLGIIVKKITGIHDISIWRKNLKKNVGKIIYHKKYTAKDLVNVMKSMGMSPGSIVCIHSSMKEFYNYTGSAEELITEILNVIGSEGTLAMPAFPSKEISSKPNYIFDKNKDKTGAGFLAETFRKYPGVKRSINIQHSVCAIGKYADWLLKDHHKCHDCWDVDSPWMRMCKLGALVFNIGMPRSYIGTFHHCVESALQYDYPYWTQFFNKKCTYRYYDEDYNILEYKAVTSKLERRTRKKKVTKYFNNNDWQIRKISNLEIKIFYTANCFPKMLDLAKHGIGVYYVPSTKGYKFDE